MRSLLPIYFVVLLGCSPAWKSVPHHRPFQRVSKPTLHREPKGSGTSDWWATTLHSTVVPLAKLLSPARYVDRLTGGRPALDVNAFGQVPDSSWFRNRIGHTGMSPKQVAAGPAGTKAPASGPLTIVSGKLEGATPGVVARDTEGTTWFVKFDPPANPELATGAEVVASRILHAAGYYVPPTLVMEVPIERFKLSPDAYRRNRYNVRVSMTAEDLKQLFANLNPNAEGNLRALFSRSVPGRPIGPFSYRGVRDDDPNDRTPHERRRSLRGLWLISAWLNNTDTRRQNTLDTFITVPGSKQGTLRHYLIDFGDSLGAAGERKKYLGEGYEGLLDWSQIGKRFLGLGFTYPYWLSAHASRKSAVGALESTVFNPARWSPGLPNPAFDEATAADTYWAASIIARFSRHHVIAAVKAAQYTDPTAVFEIVDLLMARRDKVLRYGFKKFVPLDSPVIQNDYVLSPLTDLASPGTSEAEEPLSDQRSLEPNRTWRQAPRPTDNEYAHHRSAGVDSGGHASGPRPDSSEIPFSP